MHRAPVCFLLCRNIYPRAGGLARGNKPSSLPILYKSWHRASFMILQPKFYRWCCKIICLNSLHSPSQGDNGDLGLLPMLYSSTAKVLGHPCNPNPRLGANRGARSQAPISPKISPGSIASIPLPRISPEFSALHTVVHFSKSIMAKRGAFCN